MCVCVSVLFIVILCFFVSLLSILAIDLDFALRAFDLSLSICLSGVKVFPIRIGDGQPSPVQVYFCRFCVFVRRVPNLKTAYQSND